MLGIISIFKHAIRAIITLLPDRFYRLILTIWLEKMNQKQQLKQEEKKSLEIASNMLLEKLSQQDTKLAMRSLLEMEESLNNRINQFAVQYDNGIHVKHRLTKYHDFFTERIESKETVLDIGCGNGSLAYDIVIKSGAFVTGIDINTALIQFAKQRFFHSHLTFIEGDVLSYDFQMSFNTIVLSNVLEHIENRIDFLNKIATQLNPKQILIRVPCIDRDWRVPLRKELGLFYFSDVTHYTEYTQQSFEDEVKSANLKISHLQINWGEIWSTVIPNE